MFAMSTAQITLQTEQNLVTTNTAGICFKAMASGPFNAIEKELEQLLALTERDDGLAIKQAEDSVGYRWYIFSGADFQALVTTVHMASSTLIDRGYGSQLLFALFPFKDERGKE